MLVVYLSLYNDCVFEFYVCHFKEGRLSSEAGIQTSLKENYQHVIQPVATECDLSITVSLIGSQAANNEQCLRDSLYSSDTFSPFDCRYLMLLQQPRSKISYQLKRGTTTSRKLNL